MANLKSTCSAYDCEKEVKARGLCPTHYSRLRRRGSIRRDCVTCGCEVKSLAGNAKYCSDACKVCALEGCGREAVSQGYCDGHYRRVKGGRPAVPECPGCGNVLKEGRSGGYCSAQCAPSCSVQGCLIPAYVKGQCQKHYQHQLRHGVPVSEIEVVEPADSYVCRMCGTEFGPNGRSRKFCSSKCSGLFERHGLELPRLDFACRKCGTLVERSWFEGAHQKQGKTVCAKCKPHPNNRGWYAKFYRSAEGTSGICKLCGEGVDAGLPWPHPLSKSIDHIVPVSRGGGDELENLQLAHLSCNQRKQNAINYQNA